MVITRSVNKFYTGSGAELRDRICRVIESYFESGGIALFMKMLTILQMIEEEDSADEDFWQQDFFAEEAKEEEYSASESEEEDVPDSDFSESVSLLSSFFLQMCCMWL